MNPAIWLAIVSVTLMSVMDGFMKQLSLLGYPTIQNVFMRFCVSSLVATAVLVWLRPAMTRESVIANLQRSLFFVAASVLFFSGLAVLPFAEAVALAFLAPIFIALLGVPMLGEAIGRSTYWALAIGFMGMLVMVGARIGAAGYAPGAGWGVLAILVSTLLYAIAILLMRARAKVDPVSLMVFIQNIVPVVVLALPAAYLWQAPPVGHWWIFIVAGLLGIAGHFLLVAAFARAEAAKIAALEYGHLVWAALIGYFWFGESLSAATIIGAAFIVAGAWATSRR